MMRKLWKVFLTVGAVAFLICYIAFFGWLAYEYWPIVKKVGSYLLIFAGVACFLGSLDDFGVRRGTLPVKRIS